MSIIRTAIYGGCKSKKVSYVCNYFSTKIKSRQEPRVEDVSTSTSNTDDAAFFKRLGKTTNHYWTDNAEEVLKRLNLKPLLDPKNDERLRENFRRRGCEITINLDEIRRMYRQFTTGEQVDVKQLVSNILWLPNDCHDEAMAITGDIPKTVLEYGVKTKNDVLEFQKFCDKHGILKNDNLGNLANHRSYYLKGPLAELEDALVRFTLKQVSKYGFELISVPDILYPHIIESCGMRTRGERDQVFWLELPSAPDAEVCLSGTAEMALGGCFQNRVFSLDELPYRVAAVSRCYRAERSSVEEERGIYRVHEFTKVELFAITANETQNESSDVHQEFREFQENNFKKLELHFKTVDMPPNELGTPAHRKFDVEAWMPGREMYGEISSCSNCTDFQSRRLNIRYKDLHGELKFAHTVNGTAVAIPRMLIGLVENFQDGTDGNLKLPACIEECMTRSWKESLEAFKKHDSLFLRMKSQQHKYTKEYRNMELSMDPI